MKNYITYDITARQNDVKAEMQKKGYLDNWTADTKIYNLPNTSLWHPNKANLSDTLTDINQVIANLNATKKINQEKIELLRCIITECSTWFGITGTSKR